MESCSKPPAAEQAWFQGERVRRTIGNPNDRQIAISGSPRRQRHGFDCISAYKGYGFFRQFQRDQAVEIFLETRWGKRPLRRESGEPNHVVWLPLAIGSRGFVRMRYDFDNRIASRQRTCRYVQKIHSTSFSILDNETMQIKREC